MTSDLAETMDAIAARLDAELVGADPDLADLQVYGRLVFNPTPPSIDVYPADPFQEQVAFGSRNVEVFFTVRARMTTADNVAGQDVILAMMDPTTDVSVAAALLKEPAVVDVVEPPSNYGLFVDPGAAGGLLGCTWRVGVMF